MGQDRTDPPDDGGSPEDGPVLSPDELDITADDHVRELDEGRFVVSPDEPVVDEPPERSSSRPAARVADDPTPDASDEVDGAGTLDRASVYAWLNESFANSHSRYGFDVTAQFDGSIDQHRVTSNDVVTIFESLIVWYAQQIDADTPVEEILGILLLESNVPVRYPPQSLLALLDSTDLDPDDSIAALLEAVEAEEGVEL